MAKKKITKNNRKSVVFDFKENNMGNLGTSFMEVTEWTNGDGVDIHISRQGIWGGDPTIQMTHIEFDVLKKLMKSLHEE